MTLTAGQMSLLYHYTVNIKIYPNTRNASRHQKVANDDDDDDDIYNDDNL